MSVIKAIVNFFKRIFGLAEKHVDESVAATKSAVKTDVTAVKATVAEVEAKV